MSFLQYFFILFHAFKSPLMHLCQSSKPSCFIFLPKPRNSPMLSSELLLKAKYLLAIFLVSTVLYGLGGPRFQYVKRVFIFFRSNSSPFCQQTTSALSSKFH